MTERVEPHLPINYGVLIDNIPQVMEKVISLYEEVSGIKLSELRHDMLDPNRFVKTLIKEGTVDHRFGSLISANSKLWINHRRGVVYFTFDSNVPEDLWERKGRQMEEDFRQKMNEYL